MWQEVRCRSATLGVGVLWEEEKEEERKTETLVMVGWVEYFYFNFTFGGFNEINFLGKFWIKKEEKEEEVLELMSHHGITNKHSTILSEKSSWTFPGFFSTHMEGSTERKKNVLRKQFECKKKNVSMGRVREEHKASLNMNLKKEHPLGLSQCNSRIIVLRFKEFPSFLNQSRLRNLKLFHFKCMLFWKIKKKNWLKEKSQENLIFQLCVFSSSSAFEWEIFLNSKWKGKK